MRKLTGPDAFGSIIALSLPVFIRLYQKPTLLSQPIVLLLLLISLGGVYKMHHVGKKKKLSDVSRVTK